MKVTVREGDTLWYYSQLFDVPLQLVLDSNNMKESVEPGQKLEIPGYIKKEISLENGESLWSIATKRHLPLDSLFLLNGSRDADQINEKSTLFIPIKVSKSFIQSDKPYDFNTLNKDIRRLTAIYPFIRQETIGHSVLGKPIKELNVGNGPKKVHINAAMHANEWITSSVIMTFLNDYLGALTHRRTIRGLTMAPFYDQVTLSIVPMINPDGVDLAIHGADVEDARQVIELNHGSRDFSIWKANIRGIDLNDQFPAMWEEERREGESEPGPRDYGGEKPLSEPEAIALADLTKQKNFDRVMAIHTQGEVIYWGFNGQEPPETEYIVNEFSRVSGYETERYVESYAGYKDWFEQEFHKPGFTLELGKGENPLPLTQFHEIYQKSLGVFLAHLYL
ncbi:M14 family metallopeptidase [Terrilactibacillus laevilacticus]|uniref:M14 family metallopeptidase n=1 Tax=Terrilactibacillus laevilacticus TaxID=1380157 RepID=UPI0011470A94|nr:M14 family metallopeptidase [Terrilactibacillus laevilacticus]